MIATLPAAKWDSEPTPLAPEGARDDLARVTDDIDRRFASSTRVAAMPGINDLSRARRMILLRVCGGNRRYLP